MVLAVICIGAFASAVMVGSVMPFLAVLADPSRIETTPSLARIYSAFGFSSVYGFLVALGLASVAMIILSSVIQIIKAWATAQFVLMRTHSISSRLLATYLAQPYTFFLNRHSGEMGPRILSEAGQVVSQFLRPAGEFIAALLTTVAIVGLLVWLAPLVAILSVVVLGGSYGVIYLLARKRLALLATRGMERNRERYRMANEALVGIKEIKLLGRENAYLERYALPSEVLAQTEIKQAVVSQVPQLGLQAFSLGGMILLCLALIDPSGIASGAALGDLLPTIGVFAFAGQRLMPELSKLYQSLAIMRAGSASVTAVSEDLELRPVSGSGLLASDTVLRLRAELRLQQVSFSYPNSDRAGLRDISLSIVSGEKVGIVGTTGAGKTTLADTILGLLEPQQGKLIVNGTDITEGNVRSWMRSIGYVPQDIFLIDATVSENIAFGIPPDAIDPVRVRDAARIAQLDKFIQNDLSHGYATHIGERGIRLSGGQRQRIGIARAMYHDADMIVFDEATSALDNLTEADVMKAIDALPGDKTILIIAHSLSTVRSCDRIVVIDNGRVVGCDTWDALMAGNVVFQSIAKSGEMSAVR